MSTNTIPSTIPIDLVVDTRPTAKRDNGKSQNFENFVESIKTLGLIQPLIIECSGQIDENGNDVLLYSIVVGGRRLRALKSLGYTELTHGATCKPGVPGFLFSDELTENQRLEIELDENIQRLNISWQTEALSIVQIHEARKRDAVLAGEKWGYRQTGALLNVSTGDLTNTITIVERLRANDKEIQEASGFTAALQVLMQRKIDEGNKLLVSQGLGATVNTKVPPNISTDAPKKRASGEIVVLFDDEADPASGSFNEQDGPDAPGLHTDGKTIIEIPLSQMLFHGPLETIVPATFPDNFFDIGVTDIPYGIDMDNLDLKGQSRVDKEHDVQGNAELMPKILEQYYRTLKDGAFLYFFYDLDYHERLRKWGEDIGFKVQRWPLNWCKTHPCKNQAPQYNWTKNTEYCYVMRKGNITLNKPQTTSWFCEDGLVERKMYDNPFAKPFNVWKRIFDASALPGMKVADFCAGEGSSLRAAIMCGLKPYGVEISELHYNPLVENIKSAYNVLTRGKCKFV